jgi:hypothetical protein
MTQGIELPNGRGRENWCSGQEDRGNMPAEMDLTIIGRPK